MEEKKEKLKPRFNKLLNFLFIGLLLFVMFNNNAKSWVLRQLVSVGLFSADIEKKDTNDLEVHPAFTYQDMNGKAFSTADLKGKVVFMNFWATWCPPCRAEMPSLNSMYNKLKEDNRYVILFINEDEDSEKAYDYLLKNNFQIPVTTRNSNIAQQIFSGTLPTTVVLNKEGKIVMKHEGIANYNSDDFLKQLEELL